MLLFLRRRELMDQKAAAPSLLSGVISLKNMWLKMHRVVLDLEKDGPRVNGR
jgi:hypothetical protein